jgi:hypothetical protein
VTVADASPDPQDVRALAAAAIAALTGIDELIDGDVLGQSRAAQYRIELKGMRTRLRKLADTAARAAGSPDRPHPGGKVYPVYAVEVYYSGAQRWASPARTEFRSWPELLAFLTDTVHDSHTVIVQPRYGVSVEPSGDGGG